MVIREIVKRDLRTPRVKHKPPSVSKNSGRSNVSSNYAVANEKPLGHDRFLGVTWWSAHNIVVCWIKAKSCSG